MTAAARSRADLPARSRAPQAGHDRPAPRLRHRRPKGDLVARAAAAARRGPRRASRTQSLVQGLEGLGARRSSAVPCRGRGSRSSPSGMRPRDQPGRRRQGRSARRPLRPAGRRRPRRRSGRRSCAGRGAVTMPAAEAVNPASSAMPATRQAEAEGHGGAGRGRGRGRRAKVPRVGRPTAAPAPPGGRAASSTIGARAAVRESAAASTSARAA